MYNIFQVWIEAPSEPSEQVKAYMSGNFSSMPDGATYTLISTQNYFPDNTSVSWVDVDTVISELKTKYPVLNNFWDGLSVENKSDFIRIFWMSRHKNSFYIDCDVEVLEYETRFFSRPIPYLAPYNIKGTNLDLYAIYTNNNSVFFTEFLDLFVNKSYQEYIKLSSVTYSKCFLVLNNFTKKNRVFILNKDNMIHHKDL